MSIVFKRIALHRRYAKLMKNAEASEPGSTKGELVKSFLPLGGAQMDAEQSHIKKPDGKSYGYNERFPIILTAIANADYDMSTLSENEQKIVEVCREDQMQCDRLMWGGGLL